MPAIAYHHVGSFPRYFQYALENARAFNPDARIFWITDRHHADVSALKVEVRLISELGCERLTEFHRRYVHIASYRIERLLPAFERFFLYEQLRAQENVDVMFCLDSDSMIFCDAANLVPYIPERASFSHNGAAFLVMRGTLDPFLDFIIAKYQDQELLDHFRARVAAAIKVRGMDNLTDMNFLDFALTTAGPNGMLAHPYPAHLPIGLVDYCIFGFGIDKLESIPLRRHPPRKRVFWRDEGGLMKPYFRALSDQHLVPALTIHFQNGAKRKMQRFNQITGTGLLPRALRLWYYNLLMN